MLAYPHQDDRASTGTLFMSDQGKWAKLWISVLADPDLENLELHQWARWVRLIIFMKAHGTNGKLSFSPPFRALQNVIRVASFEELIKVIINLPNFTVLQPSHITSRQPSHEEPSRYMLSCRNWYKFQGDMSGERMQKLRKKQTVTSSVTSDGKSDGLRREEKRRDVKSTSTSTPSARSASRLGATPPRLPAAQEKPRNDQGLSEEEMAQAEQHERNRAWQK